MNLDPTKAANPHSLSPGNTSPPWTSSPPAMPWWRPYRMPLGPWSCRNAFVSSPWGASSPRRRPTWRRREAPPRRCRKCWRMACRWRSWLTSGLDALEIGGFWRSDLFGGKLKFEGHFKVLFWMCFFESEVEVFMFWAESFDAWDALRRWACYDLCRDYCNMRREAQFFLLN